MPWRSVTRSTHAAPKRRIMRAKNPASSPRRCRVPKPLTAATHSRRRMGASGRALAVGIGTDQRGAAESARPSPVASIAIMPEELHGKKLRAIPVARDTWWRLCQTDADWLLPSIAIMPEELHGKKYEQSRLLAILGGDRAGRVPIGCRFASPGGPGPYARL